MYGHLFIHVPRRSNFSIKILSFELKQSDKVVLKGCQKTLPVCWRQKQFQFHFRTFLILSKYEEVTVNLKSDNLHVYRYQILQIITFSVLEILLDRSLGVKNHNSTDFPINRTPTLQNKDEVITRHILAEQELFASLFLDHLFHHILSDQFLHYVFRHILFLETVNS